MYLMNLKGKCKLLEDGKDSAASQYFQNSFLAVAGCQISCIT